MIRYAKGHPSSFLPLWDMIRMLDNGYRPFFDSLYNMLSPEIRNSHTGKQFATALQKQQITQPGKTFPGLTVFDIEGNKVVLPSVNNQYTLVDFWYSSCAPCIRLFSGFKKLYDVYHKAGFEIIAISTDDPEHVDAWKKLIKEKDLNWPQYLDKDKLNVQMLNIDRYPTNFLLDSKGRIIEQDIRPERLEKLLQSQLK